MKQVLVCKNCGSDLSLPLKFVHKADRDISFAKLVTAHTEKGVALKRYAKDWHEKFPKHLWASYFVETRIRLEDILDHVDIINLRKIDYDYGCCGVNGFLTGENRLCRCNVLVGTEFSDCETMLYFKPDLETTKWQNVKS